jgi:hypothetical protein
MTMALPQSLDPELRRRIELAVDRSDTSVIEWIERAVRHELDREESGDPNDEDDTIEPPPGVKPQGSPKPIKLRGGKTMAETVIEDRGDW